MMPAMPMATTNFEDDDDEDQKEAKTWQKIGSETPGLNLMVRTIILSVSMISPHYLIKMNVLKDGSGSFKYGGQYN